LAVSAVSEVSDSPPSYTIRQDFSIPNFDFSKILHFQQVCPSVKL